MEIKTWLKKEKTLLHVSSEWQISLALQPSLRKQCEAALLISQEKAAFHH